MKFSTSKKYIIEKTPAYLVSVWLVLNKKISNAYEQFSWMGLLYPYYIDGKINAQENCNTCTKWHTNPKVLRSHHRLYNSLL